jgi:hypothetical protein
MTYRHHFLHSIYKVLSKRMKMNVQINKRRIRKVRSSPQTEGDRQIIVFTVMPIGSIPFLLTSAKAWPSGYVVFPLFCPVRSKVP